MLPRPGRCERSCVRTCLMMRCRALAVSRSWNGFTSRDGEALRRVSRLLRYFGARHFFQNDGWEPHTPTAKPSQLYASRFPRLPEESSCAAGGETLWAIVERAGTNVSGPALVVDAASYAGCHWWDVWHGRSLSPTLSGSQLTVVLDVEAAGFGCVLATPNGTGGIQSFRDDAQLEANTPLSRLLAQASSNRRALASYASASAGDSWRGGSEPWLPAQTRVRPPPSRAHMSAPPGAVPIAGTKTYQFTASGNVCAGGAVNNCPHIQVAMRHACFPCIPCLLLHRAAFIALPVSTQVLQSQPLVRTAAAAAVPVAPVAAVAASHN